MNYRLEHTESQYKPVIEYIISLSLSLDNSKRIKILEIGAGSRILKKFMPENVIYHSLDYTGEQTYIHNLDKEKLPIKTGIYDIVVCLETLEHTMYPKKVLEEIKRVARKDAVFFLSMPNEYNIYLRLLYLFGKKNWAENKEPFLVVENHHHIQKPRVKDILKLFSDYFDVEKTYYFWYSNLGKKNNNLKFIDFILQKLAEMNPSLFTRLAEVRARNKL